jgi:hypothetical protein
MPSWIVATMLVGAMLLVVVVSFVLPSRLSWAMQVRWCMAANAMVVDPLGAWLPDLREVRIDAVDRVDDVLVLAVRGAAVAARREVLATEPGTFPSADTVGLLRDWRALGTPLVLHSVPDGAYVLLGPVPTTLGRLTSRLPV